MISRDDCLLRDANDALAPLRDLFALDRVDREGVIYLDGNSLGVLPKTAIARVKDVVENEWGSGLIRSWNTAGWITLARRIGDKIAPLIGANAGEVIAGDSTSINLFKALSAAAFAVGGRARRIISERTNFPTDLYIADTFAREHGRELVLIDETHVLDHLDDRVAILMLTHVNYRTGHMHRMRELTQAAHDAGAMVVWDLAHSAGAVPIDLHDADADFAVGCGYKYLNGGPGAPAFIWAHPRHTQRMDREGWRPPLSGWLGHAQPFAFDPQYEPAIGIQRFICGTPPVLSLAALECGVDTVLAAPMDAIRAKSIALTDLFIALVEDRCAGHGFTLMTPRDAKTRGSQVSFAHSEQGYAIMQALIARGVIGDFRAPDILRFGFTPLYTRFIDVWDAVDRLHQVMASGEWREPRFSIRAAVT
ncbi:MAG TPA: kynureninase [Vicinamibacterales bacterium]|nr:kynureninase [Vicinamibacterales bacterium]